jgi:hypothetical protein
MRPQVLEGFHALGTGDALGPEVAAAFVAAATAATLKVGPMLPHEPCDGRDPLHTPAQHLCAIVR